MNPVASQLLLWSIVFGSLLLAGLMRVAGRASDEERQPMHIHKCSVCGRVQQWVQPFDQFSPCRGCQLAMIHPPIDIDLDAFANATALRVYLNGVDQIADAQVERSTAD